MMVELTVSYFNTLRILPIFFSFSLVFVWDMDSKKNASTSTSTSFRLVPVPLLSSFDHRNYYIDHAYRPSFIDGHPISVLILVAVALSSSFHSSFLRFHSVAIAIGIVDTALRITNE
jgi:hypothetical protein